MRRQLSILLPFCLLGSLPPLACSGLLYDEVGQLDKAVEDYNKAIQLVPNDEAFFYSRGHAYFRKNMDEAAIKVRPPHSIAELCILLLLLLGIFIFALVV